MNAEDHGERLAKVETRVDTVEDNISKILTSQEAMLREFSRYKGALGMFTFLVICVATALGALREFVVAHWK